MRVVDWLMLFVLARVGGTYYFCRRRGHRTATAHARPCCCIAVATSPVSFCFGFEFPRSRAKWRDYAVMAILNNVILDDLLRPAPYSERFGLGTERHDPADVASVLRFVAGALTANKLAGSIGLAE